MEWLYLCTGNLQCDVRVTARKLIIDATAFAVQCSYYPFSNYEGTGFKSEFGDQPNKTLLLLYPVAYSTTMMIMMII